MSSSAGSSKPQQPARGQVYQAVVHGTVVQLELIAASGTSTSSVIREPHSQSSQQHPPLLSLQLENFSGTLRLVLPTSSTTTEAGDGSSFDEELGVIPEIPSVGLTASSDEAVEVHLQSTAVVEDRTKEVESDDDAIPDDTRLTITTPKSTTPWRKPRQLVGALSSLNSGDSSTISRKKHHMPATVQAVRTARRLGHLMDTSGHSSDTTDGHSTHPNVSAVSGLSSSSILAGCTRSGDILLHTPPPTELHRLCAEEVVTASELEHVRITRKDAAMPDALGRLPLHILGDNDRLISLDQTRNAITTLGLRLMQIYPEAITTLDSQGRMPFVRLIEDWVAWVQDVAVKSPKKRGMMTAGIFDRVVSQPRSGNRGKDQPNGEAGDGVGREKSESTQGQTTQQSQHSDQQLSTVELWEEVEWSLVMLSAAIEILRAGASSARLLRGNDDANTAEKSTQLREKAEEACEKLAKHCVAVAPNLLKCLLILETETRERIFAMQIVKRILFCPESVGTWLTTLLRKGSSSSRCGVMYLATVSKLTAQDRFGGQHGLSSADFTVFYEEKEQVFDAIGSLDGMVGSLVVLEEIELEKVLRTAVIWHIVSQKLSRPFVVSLVLIDFILHLTLMLAFRHSVLIYNSSATFAADVPLGVVLMICVYSIVRKASEGLAIWNYSITVFKSYFLRNGWAILDILTVILAASAVIWNETNPGVYRNGYNTFVMGLLWMKVLGFLKIVNKQFATFILSMIRIIASIRYFGVVLLIVLLMFGDMMHIAVATLDNGEYCATATDASDAVVDFCSFETSASYIRMYALLIGDFEVNDYRESTGMLILFFMFTTIGVIILLNVIIAVISDAFERASIGSDILFGKARIQFVAQNEALESFFCPESRLSDSVVDISGRRKQSFVIMGRLLRWVAFLALIASAVWSDLYLFGRVYIVVQSVIEKQPPTNSWLTAIISVLFFFALTIALWILLRITLRGFLGNFSATGAEQWLGDQKGCTSSINSKIASLLFGLGSNKVQTTSDKEGEEWNGRMAYLETAIERMISAAKEDLQGDIAALQRHLEDSH